MPAYKRPPNIKVNMAIVIEDGNSDMDVATELNPNPKQNPFVLIQKRDKQPKSIVKNTTKINPRFDSETASALRKDSNAKQHRAQSRRLLDLAGRARQAAAAATNQ
jgi:hypothetical protein